MTRPDEHLLRKIAEQQEIIRALKQAMGSVDEVPEGCLRLTATEAAIVSLLLSRDAPVTYEQIRVRVWGARLGPGVTTNTIKAHVSHIRAKLRSLGVEIESAWRVGYRMDAGGKEALRRYVARFMSGEGEA